MDSTEVLAYLNTILDAWPIFVALIVWGILRSYRREIKVWIARLRRAELPGGVVLEVFPPQFELAHTELETQARVGGKVDFQPSDGLLDLASDKLNHHFEKQIRALKSASKDYTDTVVRDWATYVLIALYERAYRHIYETQIDLLHHLQARGDGGSSHRELEFFFEQHLMRSGPEAGFNEYFRLLKDLDIVEQVGKSDRFKITKLGEGFLQYIHSTVRTIARPG